MAATQSLTLSMAAPDVAVLTFDFPGKSVNLLSRSVLDELNGHLDALETRDDLIALVFRSGKPGTFLAGADLREFAGMLDAPRAEVVTLCRRGQTVLARLAKMPFVTIAAIDGVCVGGGAELACWCDRRIASLDEKTEVGFPEVKLGLIPGWGGTVRLPRIIGLGNAVELITGDEPVGPHQAAAFGLVSDVVPPHKLLDAAIALARCEQQTSDYLRDRQTWSAPLSINDTELEFLGITASALIRQQTRGQYPAPEVALELMLEAARLDADAALQLEAERMSHLFGSPVNAALLNVFFLTNRIKKDKGVSQAPVTPREISTVGVLGAGIMGAGIAAANIKRGIPVVLSDASQEALAAGARGTMEEAAYDALTQCVHAERLLELTPLLRVSGSEVGLAACDLIVEAIVENIDIKKRVFARLEPQLGADAILASNTSTIPVSQLAAGLQRPDRFCGMHFFNPVRRMKLVEVVRGDATSDQTIVTAVAYAKRLGKLPIVVNDGPGFLVNRLLLPYMNEAMELLSEGVDIAAIDRASRVFGMPIGPIELYDLVGIDTAFYAGRTMWEAYPERISVSPILISMVKSGRLGQKTGRGFYLHHDRRKGALPDPELEGFLAPYVRGRKELSMEQLTMRLFLPMLLEATRVLEERIVRDPRDVDFGLIFGLGFPAFRGGLLFWADSLGARKILELLKPLEDLGKRTQPTPLLIRMAKEGRQFYDRSTEGALP